MRSVPVVVVNPDRPPETGEGIAPLFGLERCGSTTEPYPRRRPVERTGFQIRAEEWTTAGLPFASSSPAMDAPRQILSKWGSLIV